MAIGTFRDGLPGAFAFYLGISILIVGNGFFKPNISTIVGTLYKEGDRVAMLDFRCSIRASTLARF